jgi:hypothetical protein
MRWNTMSSDDRVARVVSAWAHLPARPNDTDLLQVLWANSHTAVPFPDAVQQLVLDLQNEFRDPPPTDVELQTTDFDPGSIKTVADLKTAVRQMP